MWRSIGYKRPVRLFVRRSRSRNVSAPSVSFDETVAGSAIHSRLNSADEWIRVFWAAILSNLARWDEIAEFWALILRKNGSKPDFGAAARAIGPFLTAIFPLERNWAEITAFSAAISAEAPAK